mmetsp:Transcript_8754/g.19401  ORF Transcript_8754/g.19401 Transcript_8754/m.19401 type:complete len:697 (-) Transcript_8754:20-2110(-)
MLKSEDQLSPSTSAKSPRPPGQSGDHSAPLPSAKSPRPRPQSGEHLTPDVKRRGGEHSETHGKRGISFLDADSGKEGRPTEGHEKHRLTTHEHDVHHHQHHHHNGHHHHAHHGHHHHPHHHSSKRGTTTEHGSQAVALAIEAIAQAQAQRKNAIAGIREDGNPDALTDSDLSDEDADERRRMLPHWKRAQRDIHTTMSAVKKMEQNEAKQELREFLKVVRPEWSLYDKRAVANIERVMDKLGAIGVYDINGLMQRVNSNSINMDLSQMGRSRFEDETLQKLRTAKSFLRAMDHLKEPFYRQTGNFAQVRQLLAKSNLWNWDEKNPENSTQAADKKTAGAGKRPASSPAGRATKVSWQDSSKGSKTEVSPRKQLERSKSAPLRSDTDPDLHRHRSRGNDAASLGRRIRQQKGYAKAAQHANIAVRRRSTVTLPEQILSQVPCDRPQLRFLTRPSSSSDPSRRAAYSEFKEMNRQRPQSASAVTHHSLANRPSQAVLEAENMRASLIESYDGSEACAPKSKASALARQKTTPAEGAGEPLTEAKLEEEVDRIQQAGATMNVLHRKARWSNLRADNLHEQADSMLEEQQALDEKTLLFKLMDHEGLASPTRQVIAGNIKHRLKDVAPRDAKLSSDVHMRSTNIRNQLQQMLEARRELRSVRKSTQALLKEDDRARVIESFKRNALIQPGALAGIAHAPR